MRLNFLGGIARACLLGLIQKSPNELIPGDVINRRVVPRSGRVGRRGVKWERLGAERAQHAPGEVIGKGRGEVVGVVGGAIWLASQQRRLAARGKARHVRGELHKERSFGARGRRSGVDSTVAGPTTRTLKDLVHGSENLALRIRSSVAFGATSRMVAAVL